MLLNLFLTTVSRLGMKEKEVGKEGDGMQVRRGCLGELDVQPPLPVPATNLETGAWFIRLGPGSLKLFVSVMKQSRFFLCSSTTVECMRASETICSR
jgi:hypothetical protein